MTLYTSAPAQEHTPHETETTILTVSEATKRCAESVINDVSIDPQWRTIIRAALELGDPLVAELVNRAEANEDIVDTFEYWRRPDVGEGDSNVRKIETLAEIICRAGDEATAALFVLMGTLQNSADPNAVANTAKHFAFNRCADLNLYGLVDGQITAIEGELLASTTFES